MIGPKAEEKWPGLDEVVEAFEEAQARGGPAEVVDFAPPPDHPDRLAILCELIRVDLELRWGLKEPRPLERYRDLFPDLFEDAGLLHAVAFEEYRLRLQAGETPTPAEYRSRFGLDGVAWPSPGIAAPAPADDLGRAASAYRAYRRQGTGRPEELEFLLDTHEVPREQAELLRDLDRSDPHAAEVLAEAVAGLPHVGDRFLGFHLCGELGRGAFGRVYLARQGDLADRLVALKVSASVATETRALAQLQHTNVVPIHSVHRRGPLQAVCMPYLGATTLADTLANLKGQATMPRSGRALVGTIDSNRGPGPSRVTAGPGASTAVKPPGWDGPDVGGPAPDECHAPPPPTATPQIERLRGLNYVPAVLWLVSRVADGLAHAHERGILHRDLKPANILFADDGEPLLLDFNLATDTKVRASFAHVGGTLPYMAPEHLAAFRDGGPEADARGDLYAVGVILYELLSGTHPFPVRRGTADEVVAAMIADRLGPAPDVRRANPEVSPAEASIVRHCLEPNPLRRYQAARELQEDLRRQLEDLPLRHAAEPSVRERVRKWARRHPRLSSATALGVAASVLIAGIVAGYAHRQRRFEVIEAAHALRLVADDHEVAGILLLDPAADGALREEGLETCRRALARVGALDSPGWLGSAPARDLPAEGRAELRAHVGDLLMLQSRALARQAAGEGNDRRRELVRLALAQNALAESCYAPAEVPRSYWVQRADLSRRVGDADAARRALERAGTTPIRSPREYALLSLEDPEGSSSREAIPALAEASLRSPQDFPLWMYLGICHALHGRVAEAEDCFTVAVVLRPHSPWPYFHRGRVEVDRGEYGHARIDLDQAIRLRPGLPAAHINRALARLGQGDHADAIADLDLALDLGAHETRVFFIRAEARDRSGDRAGAARDRAEGLRRVPSDAESWVARGLARLGVDAAGALADFEEALKLSPRSRSALQNKAAVLSEHLGRAEEAVAVLDRAIEAYPEYVPARVGRGVLLARMGRRLLAHRDAEESGRRDSSCDTSYRVACIYALTSKTQDVDRPRAFRALAAALARDAAWVEVARKDPDLDALRGHGEFGDLLRAFAEPRVPDG